VASQSSCKQFCSSYAICFYYKTRVLAEKDVLLRDHRTETRKRSTVVRNHFHLHSNKIKLQQTDIIKTCFLILLNKDKRNFNKFFSHSRLNFACFRPIVRALSLMSNCKACLFVCSAHIVTCQRKKRRMKDVWLSRIWRFYPPRVAHAYRIKIKYCALSPRIPLSRRPLQECSRSHPGSWTCSRRKWNSLGHRSWSKFLNSAERSLWQRGLAWGDFASQLSIASNEKPAISSSSCCDSNTQFYNHSTHFFPHRESHAWPGGYW